MGEVYLAQDTRLDRRVALKILPPEFASDADRMRRFVLEARSASALNHPNIITIYEIGKIDNTHFIATEYIEGQTLNTVGKLPVREAIDVATQIAFALQAAHNSGIIHRDIKPENVVLRPDGLVKILDFGIAKVSGAPLVTDLMSGTDGEAATAMKASTRTGMIIGTANYMSPEQARGKSIDARSDIFSFGVLLYEMLSGKRPFVGENAMDVIGSIIADDPEPVGQIVPSLPEEVDRIITKTLRKNRDERYQTASELVLDLRNVRMRLEFEAEFERSTQPVRTEEAPTTIGPLPETTSKSDLRRSIAVIPFSNISTDPENEYFCDGLADELLNALTKIDVLKVAARSSSFLYKGQNKSVSDIGRTLGVGTVLEGSVRKFGERVRISVQLVNAADGYQLWSERYDREMKDIFQVQDEITLAVVDALKVRLLGDEKEEVLKRFTENAEAYQLYLRGRFFFFKRTPEGFRKAIQYFEQAIALDPDYAVAYSGLADCYTFLGFYEAISPAEALQNLKGPAFKSLELDDRLAETQTSVALYHSLYQWDLRGGDRRHKRAIALNPKYAFAHHLESATLILLGRCEESIKAEQRAIELEPFTAIFNASLGWWLYLSRRNDEAIEQSLKTIEIAPNHFFAHWVLGLALAREGKYSDAIESFQKGITLTGGNQHIKGELGRVLAQSGRHAEAKRILDELQSDARDEYVSAVNVAKIYLGLGEAERLFEWLNKAVAERSIKLPWFLFDPCLDQFRSDPRFQDVCRRANMVPGSPLLGLDL